MNKADVLAYFGSERKVAEALGIEPPAVYQWETVPDLRQLQIEMLTGGRLRAESRLKPLPLPPPERVA